jgi:hypothetical protein
MNASVVRFDAPFWVALLAGVILVGSMGFIALAAAAQGQAKTTAALVYVGHS